jgi:hypothetical protein
MAEPTQARALTPLNEITLEGNGRIAWRLLVQTEATALRRPPSSSTRDDPLVGVRVLGHLLEDF